MSDEHPWADNSSGVLLCVLVVVDGRSGGKPAVVLEGGVTGAAVVIEIPC